MLSAYFVCLYEVLNNWPLSFMCVVRFNVAPCIVVYIPTFHILID